jgi:hypothetical protein
MSKYDDTDPLEMLAFSTRAWNVISQTNCATFGDVRTMTDNELTSIRGCGPHALREIRKVCQSKGNEGHTTDITLRDHFAGLAMQALIVYGGTFDPSSAWNCADAMLKARNQ